MEYLVEIRFDDQENSSIIHFITTFTASSKEIADLFLSELFEAFKRKGALVLHHSCEPIEDDPKLRGKQYEYLNSCLSKATAKIGIEQFFIENPDQSKSLIENLKENLYNGEDPVAIVGDKHSIPVRVTEKGTLYPVEGDIFYYSVEHLIPKN